MTFEIDGHTADIRLSIHASSLPDLFREAARGLYAILGPTHAVAADRDVWRVELDAVDTTALLVDFLNELLYRAQTARAVAEEIDFVEIADCRVVVEIESRVVESFGEDVKAVTYHEAEVVDDGGILSTSLVLDI